MPLATNPNLSPFTKKALPCTLKRIDQNPLDNRMKTRFLPLALCLALTACLSVPYVPAPKQLSAASAQEALTQVQAGLAEDPNNPGLNAQAAELYLSLGQW